MPKLLHKDQATMLKSATGLLAASAVRRVNKAKTRKRKIRREIKECVGERIGFQKTQLGHVEVPEAL